VNSKVKRYSFSFEIRQNLVRKFMIKVEGS
jgi:hypothetical protein